MEHRERIIPVLLVIVLPGGGCYLWSNGLLPGAVPTVSNDRSVCGFIKSKNTRSLPKLPVASAL